MPIEILSALLVLAVLILILLGRLDRKLSRQGRQLDAILEHFELSLPSFVVPSAEVLALLEEPSGKIPAIRRYREETGLGLAEASAAVESFMAARTLQRGG